MAQALRNMLMLSKGYDTCTNLLTVGPSCAELADASLPEPEAPPLPPLLLPLPPLPLLPMPPPLPLLLAALLAAVPQTCRWPCFQSWACGGVTAHEQGVACVLDVFSEQVPGV